MKLNSDQDSYTNSLERITLIGACIGGGFEVFFTLYHLFSRANWLLVAVIAFALVVDLTGLYFVLRLRKRVIAAHLVSASLFLSLSGISLFSGGIHSSSLVWLMLVPLVSALMAGRKSGLVWGGISAAAALAIYGLNQWAGIDLSIQQPTALDRLVDIVLGVGGVTLATVINEGIKERIIHRLDLTQAVLEEQANLDALTCAYNRRYLYSYVQGLFNQKEKSNAEIALLMMDIDYFKDFNDAHGHPAGDQILSEFVRAASPLLRESQILARYGGDEFIAVLPYTNAKKAARLAEDLRAVIEKTALETVFGDYPVTISIGVTAGHIKDYASVEALIESADQALYKAKQGGRNQVAF